MKQRMETFIAAYLEAIDFTQLGDVDQPSHNAELTADAMREQVTDAATFFVRYRCLWNCHQDEQAGHDFWLTRNGHGAGFWDRPELYGNPETRALTAAAEEYGETWPEYDEDPE